MMLTFHVAIARPLSPVPQVYTIRAKTPQDAYLIAEALRERLARHDLN